MISTTFSETDVNQTTHILPFILVDNTPPWFPEVVLSKNSHEFQLIMNTFYFPEQTRAHLIFFWFDFTENIRNIYTFKMVEMTNVYIIQLWSISRYYSWINPICLQIVQIRSIDHHNNQIHLCWKVNVVSISHIPLNWDTSFQWVFGLMKETHEQINKFLHTLTVEINCHSVRSLKSVNYWDTLQNMNSLWQNRATHALLSQLKHFIQFIKNILIQASKHQSKCSPISKDED